MSDPAPHDHHHSRRADEAARLHQDFGQRFWEQQYRDRTGHHPGDPNEQLVAEVSGLATGTALDAGCGEGRDAIWLASRGWHVTAVDFSPTALRRARERAAAASPGVAHLIAWVPADLTVWTPERDSFDLVTAQYVHVPAASSELLVSQLAAAVAPGGTLLIVGHHPSDLTTTMARGTAPELYLTAEQVLATLEPDRWEVAVAEARPHRARDPEGHEVNLREAVLRARKRLKVR